MALTRLFAVITFTLSIMTLVSLRVSADTVTNVHLRGVVVPGQQAKLSVAQNGQIVWIAPGGSIVRQGEKLAQINDIKLRAELSQARAMFHSAEAEMAAAQHSLEKSRRLVNENILSDIALTEAEFSVQTAKAKVEVNRSKYQLAELAVEQAILLAPFEGVVASTKLSAGEWAQPGDPIIEFVSLSELTMSIDIPPQLTDNLKVGDSTEVMFNDSVIGKASVKRLFPILQPSSGLRRVVWSVETNDSMLISGRYVELKAWF